MRTLFSAALIAVVATTGTASASAAPQPVWWQGSYGHAPFYGRQIVADPPSNDCVATGLIAVLKLLNPYYCSAARVSPANHAGGDFVVEYSVCAGQDSKDYTQHFDGGPENRFEIDDVDTGAIVRHWTEPSSYTPSDYTLHAGDCAFYLWNEPMVTDAGTPLTSGHRFVAKFGHTNGPETITDEFVAP